MGFRNPFGKNYTRRKGAPIVTPPGGGGGGGEPPPPPPPVTGRNKNGGNYIGMAGSPDGADWTTVINTLSADSTGKWKGVQIRQDWRLLERASGEYRWTTSTGQPGGFNKIDQLLSQIKPFNGNKLIIMFQLKQFNFSLCVPDYMRTAAYADPSAPSNADYFGCYRYQSVNNPGSGGYVVSMHIDAVRERFKALMSAFAAAYNNHPQVEAIIFNEASINKPAAFTWTAAQRDKWFNNTTNAYTFTVSKFTKVNLLQFFNSDRIDMSTWANNTLTGWIPDIVNAGVGLGMTDGCRNDLSFQFVPAGQGPAPNSNNPGSIFIINRFSSKVPVVVNMSGPAQVGSIAAFAQTADPTDNIPQYTFPGPAYARNENQRWAREDIGANYVLWTIDGHTYGPTYTVNGNTYTVANIPSDTPNGSYSGKKFFDVTKAWINHASSNITTAPFPTNW